MPLPIIADTIRLAVRGTLVSGHPFVNVVHLRKTSALSFAAAIAIADPVMFDLLNTDHAPGSAWKNMSPSGARIVDFAFTPLDGSTATTVIPHALAGLDGGDPLPSSVALVVTLRTAKRGRSYRGRVYCGPFTETSNLNGLPAVALPPKLSGQWGWLINTGLAGSGISLVVASYLHSTAENVTAVGCDARWDTQRKRLNV